MFLKYKDIQLNILINDIRLLKESHPVFFLHGFTGDVSDWKFLFNQLPNGFVAIAIDIIGHGKSSSPKDVSFYSFSSIVDQLNFIIDELSLSKITLVGYSMGGRVALSYALKFPNKINKLVLESSTAGISDKKQKAERILNDDKLAMKIETEGIKNFIDFWLNLPLFSSLDKLGNSYLEQIKQKRYRNNSVGLANFLKGFGTGKMPDYWEKLRFIKSDTLLITGEYDTKFKEINSKMELLLTNAQHKIVKNCGHNVHLEKPEEFIILLNDFLIN